ncbi:MAG TPA: aminoacyl-tRNA hydrolase [Candidatus Paceibacterota bacterium]
MKYFLVGLGNSGDEYEKTRHNSGRRAVMHVAKKFDAEFESDKKLRALTATGRSDLPRKVGPSDVVFVLPETMMNGSGRAVAPAIKNKKDLSNLIVFYDDIDLPIGTFKISFNRGSGGHKGLESVIRAVKSREFYRVRIGICPTTPGGKLKKPDAKKFVDFILGDFKPNEEKELKKVFKKITEAMEVFTSEGPSYAMSQFN